MKVLFLVQDEQKVILDALYDAICAACDCDLRRLSSKEQSDLKGYFSHHVQVEKYDRIVFFLRFKKELQQIDFIRTIPNLVTLEHDACQNYIDGKYRGYFSYYYQSIPWIRVICSGFTLAERLRAEGTDAICVPKGYDENLLCDLNQVRDIELGFIGSLGAEAYAGRKKLLEELKKEEPSLSLLTTASGLAYRDCLNRIKFFINADIGFDEYMIKNFEAMACGCVLFTYAQIESENNALGFVDMRNVVLFSSIKELREKLSMLRADPVLANEIAKNGRELAERNYCFSIIGKKIVNALQEKLRAPKKQERRSLQEIIRLRWNLYRSK